MIVVADTGPIHYLVLSGFIGTLHDLYGVVVLPEAVRNELSHPLKEFHNVVLQTGNRSESVV